MWLFCTNSYRLKAINYFHEKSAIANVRLGSKYASAQYCPKSQKSKWDKVFNNGPSKICGTQPLKNLKGYGLLKQTISLKFFKGCLPQNLLSTLLNTLFRMNLYCEKLRTHRYTDIIDLIFNCDI